MKYILIFFFLILPLVSFGQTTISGSSDIGLILSPASPGSNTTALAKITSYAVNLNASSITWRVNGKTVLTGIGKTSTQFKTGSLGTKTTISVTVINDGRKFEKEAIIHQNDIDLLWETLDGYSPDFYRGKIFPAPGTTVVVTALPNLFLNGKEVPADKLFYDWQINFQPQPEKSGVGKQTFIFIADTSTNNIVVEVVVRSINNQLLMIKKSIVISVPPLTLVIYPFQPLVGTFYGTALKGDYRPIENNLRLKAEVFNLWRDDYDNLNFKWLLNNQEILVDQNTPQTLEFNQNQATSSRSFLTVTAENPLNIFQTARELLTIYFGNSVQF